MVDLVGEEVTVTAVVVVDERAAALAVGLVGARAVGHRVAVAAHRLHPPDVRHPLGGAVVVGRRHELGDGGADAGNAKYRVAGIVAHREVDDDRAVHGGRRRRCRGMDEVLARGADGRCRGARGP